MTGKRRQTVKWIISRRQWFNVRQEERRTSNKSKPEQTREMTQEKKKSGRKREYIGHERRMETDMTGINEGTHDNCK